MTSLALQIDLALFHQAFSFLFQEGVEIRKNYGEGSKLFKLYCRLYPTFLFYTWSPKSFILRAAGGHVDKIRSIYYKLTKSQ